MKISLTILLLTFFTNTFSFGQLTVEDLNIDTTITAFHFAVNFQGTQIYTLNGAANLSDTNPSAFSYTVMPNASYHDALEQIDRLLNMSIQDGYKLIDIQKKDTIVNGNRGYYISFTEIREGSDYKNFVFDAFIVKNDTVILFVSGDFDNGKYIENFKKTFYSTKL